MGQARELRLKGRASNIKQVDLKSEKWQNSPYSLKNSNTVSAYKPKFVHDTRIKDLNLDKFGKKMGI